MLLNYKASRQYNNTQTLNAKTPFDASGVSLQLNSDKCLVLHIHALRIHASRWE